MAIILNTLNPSTELDTSLSCVAPELCHFEFLDKMAAGRHLGFGLRFRCSRKMTSRDVAGCPSMATSTPNLVKISETVADLWRFSLFQNGGRPPSWIDPTDLWDHPRWRLGGLKCPVKIHIDLTYCFEDIENSIFLTFGLK